MSYLHPETVAAYVLANTGWPSVVPCVLDGLSRSDCPLRRTFTYFCPCGWHLLQPMMERRPRGNDSDSGPEPGACS